MKKLFPFIFILFYSAITFGSSSYLIEGYILVDEDIRLHYRITGHGQDTIVVPDVGWFYPYIEKQNPEQTYIVYDVRDRGYSDPVENLNLISFEHEISDLEKVRKHFNIGKINLVGWSYLGGVVALYAALHPDHVKSIVQVGPILLKKNEYWDFFVHDRMSRRDVNLENRLTVMNSEGLNKKDPELYCKEYWKAAILSMIADANRIQEYTQNIPCDCPNEYPENLSFGTILSKLDEWDWSDQIKNIKAPVLVIHGIKDNIPIESSMEWAEKIPNGKLISFENSGHMPMAEEPEKFYSTLSEFLERNKRRIAWNKLLISGNVFTREHNSFLLEAIKNVPPGKALDVAMGEGRNTLLLARNGWETTGFDIADEAMDSACDRAGRENLTIETVTASRDEFDFGTNKWDLIACIYSDIVCGGCCAYDEEFIATIKNALKPGGRIVYEWFTREAILDAFQILKDQESWGCRENSIKEAFQKLGGFRIIHYSEELGIPEWDPTKKFDPVKLIYFIGEKL
jgi:pimeloyl-ACP methyl ester carboxylesterase/ubiquinone/menaquinone biosynthesis C-methylase UbiE